MKKKKIKPETTEVTVNKEIIGVEHANPGPSLANFYSPE